MENNKDSDTKKLTKTVEDLTKMMSNLTYEIGYMNRLMRDQVDYQRYCSRYRDMPLPPRLR